MSKRKGSKRPALNDWHLWSEVTSTVSPLPRRHLKKSAQMHAGTAQLETHQLENLEDAFGQRLNGVDAAGKSHPFSPAHGGGKLFRNQPGGGTGAVWAPSATAIRHLPDEKHPNESIEPKMRRRVRRGQIPIDGRLDLHGLHQHEARNALHRFISARVARGDRTLLVITGKGLKKKDATRIVERGVLRHMLPLWLNEPALKSMIAGYEVSAQHHGGEGAYYIRLKRMD